MDDEEAANKSSNLVRVGVQILSHQLPLQTVRPNQRLAARRPGTAGSLELDLSPEPRTIRCSTDGTR